MPTSRRHAGFTLLEVMCAFTILALVISIVVVIWSNNIDMAIDAIDKRELREVADTIFGKILFEQQEHRDGDEGSLAVIYGQWSGLPPHRADRWRDYYYLLRKQDYVAAGEADPDEDAEQLFGSSTEDDEDTGTQAPGAEGAEAVGNVKLVKFTVTVFRLDAREETLITLTRYLKPPDLGDGK